RSIRRDESSGRWRRGRCTGRTGAIPTWRRPRSWRWSARCCGPRAARAGAQARERSPRTSLLLTPFDDVLVEGGQMVDDDPLHQVVHDEKVRLDAAILVGVLVHLRNGGILGRR